VVRNDARDLVTASYAVFDAQRAALTRIPNVARGTRIIQARARGAMKKWCWKVMSV